MSERDDRPQPELGTLALALSGGGVRAVGFHLGTLEMLERLGLRERITILSTVSGGSLTGIGYALAQRHGHSFDRFFQAFYRFLPRANTIELLLRELAGPAAALPGGHRHLITALANVYDEIYFREEFGPRVDGQAQSPRFAALLDPDAPIGHLREVVFNATEFQTGSAFRFQRSQYRCLIGNAQIQLCPKHAGQLRIADVMAASSCIPAGMEPLFFPQDFHWPDDRPGHRPTADALAAKLRDRLHRRFRLHPDRRVDHFALMDGGVYDNQGIVSLLLAMNRQATRIPPDPPAACTCGESLYAEEPAPGPDQWARWLAGKAAQGTHEEGGAVEAALPRGGLMVISDTPVRKDSEYPRLGQRATALGDGTHGGPREGHGLLGRLTIGGLEWLGWAVAVILLVSAGLHFHEDLWVEDGWRASSPLGLAVDLLQVGIPLLFMSGVGVALLLARARLRGLSARLYEVLPPARWGPRAPGWYLRRLRIADVLEMLRLRAGSVSALAASIFMNRIRALSYSAAYTREDTGERIVPNQIFALEEPDLALPAEAAPLGDDARSIVTLAANMATKLWINDIEAPAADAPVALSEPLRRATGEVVAFNARRRAADKAPLNDLDVLVICGQLTTCCTLMTHLHARHRDAQGQWRDADARQVYDRALALWNRAQDDPAALLDERKGAFDTA